MCSTYYFSKTSDFAPTKPNAYNSNKISISTVLQNKPALSQYF